MCCTWDSLIVPGSGWFRSDSGVTRWDLQEVFDSEGRKRLHGAFTGGFSAGYFNTVGSKEGWTPATFVSSRSNRAKITAQRTEDFMDAEDVAEQATGGKQVLELCDCGVRCGV